MGNRGYLPKHICLVMVHGGRVESTDTDAQTMNLRPNPPQPPLLVFPRALSPFLKKDQPLDEDEFGIFYRYKNISKKLPEKVVEIYPVLPELPVKI